MPQAQVGSPLRAGTEQECPDGADVECRQGASAPWLDVTWDPQRRNVARMRVARPRSLAEELRRRSDEDLAALLHARPDLLNPVPADLSALSSRATTTSSIARVLDRLDLFHLQVCEAVAAAGEGTTYAQIQAGVRADANLVMQALGRLHALGLLWGDANDVHLVRAVHDAMGPWPGGLGPSCADSRRGVRAYAENPQLVLDAVSEAPGPVREIVDQMSWVSPEGKIAHADRPVDVKTARTPIEWLLARDLLVPRSNDTVVMPSEVAMPLRADQLIRNPQPAPPDMPVTRQNDPALIDRTAAGSAYEFVRLVESLLESWSVSPPPVLRAGGLGVRELARSAMTLDRDIPTTSLAIEVAFATGLLANNSETEAVWAPTPAYDAWLARPVAERWALLAVHWLNMTRMPSLVSLQPSGSARTNSLSDDMDRPAAPDLRRATLDVLLDTEPGSSVDPDAVLAVARWRRPRQVSASRDALCRAVLAEAAVVGVSALDSLSSIGRTLLTTDEHELARADARADGRSSPGRAPVPASVVAQIEGLLPRPVDHVLLQGDLTAVAPGILDSELARELSLIAEVDSTGGATVYRFSESSIRRGIDAGRTGADIRDFLTRHSRTPVPQALEYLIGDVARRHGSLRVGIASAYVRCDDETLLTTLLAEPKLAALRLTRLAPSVLVSGSPPDFVLERLVEAGFAPAGESNDGSVVARPRQVHRTPPRPRPPRLTTEPPTPTPALLNAAVKALRAGEAAAEARPASGRTDADDDDSSTVSAIPRASVGDTVDLINFAMSGDEPIWIGYVDSAGLASERVVEPLRFEGGFLTGYDHRSGEVRTFALARITGASAIAPVTVPPKKRKSG